LNCRLRAKYGLTTEMVARMSALQNHKCALCKQRKKLVIDHCHSTGKVRGLLCHRCNTSLGWIETHPVVLSRLAKYLDKPCHADVLLEIANR
jgi:ethanolamine ammonia-lyase large subunit